MANVRDIGRKLYVDPERRAEFIQIMQERDTVTDFESRIYRKDGSIIWIAENVRAIRDPRGRLLYYEGTVEDITQRKLAEEKLRNSETLYHSLVETLPQNIFRKDLQERFTFVNQGFAQTMGRNPAEILGKTDFEFNSVFALSRPVAKWFRHRSMNPSVKVLFLACFQRPWA